MRHNLYKSQTKANNLPKCNTEMLLLRHCIAAKMWRIFHKIYSKRQLILNHYQLQQQQQLQQTTVCLTATNILQAIQHKGQAAKQMMQQKLSSMWREEEVKGKHDAMRQEQQQWRRQRGILVVRYPPCDKVVIV